MHSKSTSTSSLQSSIHGIPVFIHLKFCTVHDEVQVLFEAYLSILVQSFRFLFSNTSMDVFESSESAVVCLMKGVDDTEDSCSVKKDPDLV